MIFEGFSRPTLQADDSNDGRVFESGDVDLAMDSNRSGLDGLPVEPSFRESEAVLAVVLACSDLDFHGPNRRVHRWAELSSGAVRTEAVARSRI